MSDGIVPEADREQFIRDNAVAIVNELEALVRRQRDELHRQYGAKNSLRAELAKLQGRIAAEHPEASEAAEELAKKFRETSRASDGKPEGTRESLERCAKMFDAYAPDLFPANEKGQVHFARAMMESAADEIRAFLAASVPPSESRRRSDPCPT